MEGSIVQSCFFSCINMELGVVVVRVGVDLHPISIPTDGQIIRCERRGVNFNMEAICNILINHRA